MPRKSRRSRKSRSKPSLRRSRSRKSPSKTKKSKLNIPVEVIEQSKDVSFLKLENDVKENMSKLSPESRLVLGEKIRKSIPMLSTNLTPMQIGVLKSDLHDQTANLPSEEQKTVEELFDKVIQNETKIIKSLQTKKYLKSQITDILFLLFKVILVLLLLGGVYAWKGKEITEATKSFIYNIIPEGRGKKWFVAVPPPPPPSRRQSSTANVPSPPPPLQPKPMSQKAIRKEEVQTGIRFHGF